MANLLGALVAVVRSTNEWFNPCVSQDIGRVFTVQVVSLRFDCGPVVIDGGCPHCGGDRAYLAMDLQILRGGGRAADTNPLAGAVVSELETTQPAGV